MKIYAFISGIGLSLILFMSSCEDTDAPSDYNDFEKKTDTIKEVYHSNNSGKIKFHVKLCAGDSVRYGEPVFFEYTVANTGSHDTLTAESVISLSKSVKLFIENKKYNTGQYVQDFRGNTLIKYPPGYRIVKYESAFPWGIEIKKPGTYELIFVFRQRSPLTVSDTVSLVVLPLTPEEKIKAEILSKNSAIRSIDIAGGFGTSVLGISANDSLFKSLNKLSNKKGHTSLWAEYFLLRKDLYSPLRLGNKNYYKTAGKKLVLYSRRYESNPFISSYFKLQAAFCMRQTGRKKMAEKLTEDNYLIVNKGANTIPLIENTLKFPEFKKRAERVSNILIY